MMTLTKELAAEVESQYPYPTRANNIKSPAPLPAFVPVAASAVPPPHRLLDTLTSDERKRYPMCAGLIDYFPDACAAVSNVSFEGNEKHNPGEPLHWSRGKSMDHADCILRHLTQRGGFDGGIRHTAALAWRALALLQEELEAEKNLGSPRGAKLAA